MQDKLATLRRLIDEGYELQGIDSDGDCVLAEFRHPDMGRRTTLRLFATDAERLLFAPRRLGRVWIRR